MKIYKLVKQNFCILENNINLWVLGSAVSGAFLVPLAL